MFPGRHPRPPSPASVKVEVKVVAFVFALSCCLWLGATLLQRAWTQNVVIDEQRFFLLGDDAMISMRYAYNLAHGRGLVWNTGEYVQGITNLGWTLVMTIPHWLGASVQIAPLVVMILNILLHVSIVALVFLWCWRRGQFIRGIIAAPLVAFDGSTAVWGVLGFETLCQALLVTAAVLPFLDASRHRRLAPIWAALAVVVRPDSLILFGWVVAMAAYQTPEQRDEARAKLRSLLAGALIVALLFLFQRSYYGEWLPNTFHLKVTHGAASVARGLQYVGRFAWEEFFGLPLLLAPAAHIAWKACRGGWLAVRRLLPLTTLPVLWTGYVVVVGGDTFCCGRFFVPIIPILALSAGALAEELVLALRTNPRTLQGLAAAVLGTLLACGLWRHVERWGPLERALGVPLPENISSVMIAETLRKTVPTNVLIGVFPAGTTPYLMPEHRFHDFLGKSDPVIARSEAHPGPPGLNKWDYRYSLERIRPDIIVTGSFRDSEQEYRRMFARGTDYGFQPELWLNPVFQAEYRPNRISILPYGKAVEEFFWVYGRRGSELGALRIIPDPSR